MKIEYKGKDQNWQDETTNYWFEVDGETYAASDHNGEISYLDCDGCPVDQSYIAMLETNLVLTDEIVYGDF